MGGIKYTVERLEPGIASFLHRVLEKAALHVSFQVTDGSMTHPDFESPDVTVKFSGPDVDLLLANKGELLLALEHLTMESLRLPPEDHSRLCFDANDYRVMRIEELRLSALAAAEKVTGTGVPFRFNPMNSRERRIIHVALRDQAAIRSESAGGEPHRHVVIYPAGMASLPAPPPPPPPPRRSGPSGPPRRSGPGGPPRRGPRR